MIIFFVAKDGEALYSQQKQDWELTVAQDKKFLIAKFRLKLKKVGKTTRPFRYDLNQILYDYAVEMTNKFKGLDLIRCLKSSGRRFVTLYGVSDQKHPQENKCKNASGFLRRTYKIADKRREAKGKGEKG